MFIAFEGIDGSGKDTQIKTLKNSLLAYNKDFDIAVIETITDSNLGKAIRSTLKEEYMYPMPDYRIMASAFIREINLISDGIKIKREDNPKDNTIYIANRWIYSTMAYNSKNAIDMQDIYKSYHYTIKPDILVYLRVNPILGLERISGRDGKDLEVFETDDHLERVYKNYEYIFSNYKFEDTLLLDIDGSKDKDDIASMILSKVLDKLNEKR